MSDSPTNTRSVVIGSLLALLSASCLVAFALVAGSTDYPSGPPVAAVEPTTSAPAVTLTARSKRNSDRPRVRPGRENDPTTPIVLGVRITDPEPSDESRGGGRGRDRDGGKDSKGSKGSKQSKTPGDKNSDGSNSPLHVAKPITRPPVSDDDDHVPPGHAYGHYKKDEGSSKGYSSSSKGGPPAHAQANGHDKHSNPGSEAASGPPAHAQANGHDKHSKD